MLPSPHTPTRPRSSPSYSPALTYAPPPSRGYATLLARALRWVPRCSSSSSNNNNSTRARSRGQEAQSRSPSTRLALTPTTWSVLVPWLSERERENEGVDRGRGRGRSAFRCVFSGLSWSFLVRERGMSWEGERVHEREGASWGVWCACLLWSVPPAMQHPPSTIASPSIQHPPPTSA
eukprot:2642060-Rhodomonas_salina.9